jgi:hypothetical protein
VPNEPRCLYSASNRERVQQQAPASYWCLVHKHAITQNRAIITLSKFHAFLTGRIVSASLLHLCSDSTNFILLRCASGVEGRTLLSGIHATQAVPKLARLALRGASGHAGCAVPDFIRLTLHDT